MSYTVPGGSKVKIALTISRNTRNRIDVIMERTGATLTDVVNDLLIIGLDASADMELADADTHQESTESETMP